jgi:hypothetical protein
LFVVELRRKRDLGNWDSAQRDPRVTFRSAVPAQPVDATPSDINLLSNRYYVKRLERLGHKVTLETSLAANPLFCAQERLLQVLL